MQADFWHQRWAANQIGFHQRRASPYLERFWPDLALAPDAQVLVPLCGKSLDLCWLAEKGHRVLGVELSEKAVRDFFTEHQWVPEIRQQGAFKVFAHGLIELWCGDIFALTATDVAHCAGLYDRAALIALPETMRARYTEHLNALLPAKCAGLLITLDYDQARLDGPPFSVPDHEVQRLLAPAWQLTLLEVKNVLEQSPKFLQAGAERLEERVYQMARS
jgi:thiopurine S-methyltransferase